MTPQVSYEECIASCGRPMSTVGMASRVLEICPSVEPLAISVGKYLNRDMNGLAESAETGSSESIGSIVTVGVVLNDNAAV